MRKKRILYVITKLELGGAQKQLLSLIRCLDRGTNEVFLFTAKKGLLMPEASAIPGLCLKKSGFLERPLNPVKDLLALCEICRFIRENRIDIVHTHSSKAGIIGRLAAKLSGVNIVVHTVHGWPFNDYQPVFARLLYIWLERVCANFTARLIVVSRYDREKGLSNRIGNSAKYTLIRYGIDYREFSADVARARRDLGIAGGDLIVGMIACFKPQKAPCDFIKLAAMITKEMPGVKFILAGDGALRKKIEGLIDKLKLTDKVMLLGWRSDIPRFLSAVDVFVLTSLWEGLPIAVLEAMASSRPVVATDTGGVREVVSENKTGFLVAREDISGMAGKLMLLLRDKNIREVIGQNARVGLGNDFQLEAMAKATCSLYESLFTGKGVASAN